MDTFTVTPFDMQGWSFAEEVAAGEGGFEEGPDGATGAGSARLVVDAVGRETLSTTAFDGRPISDFTALNYRTFQDADSPGADIYAVSLQLDIDYDSTDGDAGPQSRIVYEPYYQADVSKGAWQDWNAREGKWWAVLAPGNLSCPQASPCPYSDFVTAFPHAVVRGSLALKAGGPWGPGFSGNVDGLYMGFADGTSRTYDFEPGEGEDTGSDVDSGNDSGSDSGSDSGDCVVDLGDDSGVDSGGTDTASPGENDGSGDVPAVTVTCDACEGGGEGGGTRAGVFGVALFGLAGWRRRLTRR